MLQLNSQQNAQGETAPGQLTRADAADIIET